MTPSPRGSPRPSLTRVLRWWSVNSAGHRLTRHAARLPGLALPGLAMPGSAAAPQQMVGHHQSHEEAGHHSDDHQSDDCEKFAHR